MSFGPSGDDKRVDLVFEGGDVEGIGWAGAFSYLDEHAVPAHAVRPVAR